MSRGPNPPYTNLLEKIRRDPETGKIQRLGLIDDDWLQFLLDEKERVDLTPQQVGKAKLTDQEATIDPTAIVLPSGGLYRVSFYTRITRASSGTSSLTLGFNFPEGGNQGFVYPSLITNTTFTIQSDTFLFRTDGLVVTFNAAYVSTGVTRMQFRLDVIVEQMPDDETTE